MSLHHQNIQNVTSLSVSLGTLRITWSEQDFIQSIEWVTKPEDERISFEAILLMPPSVRILVRSLQAFFTTGEPLDERFTKDLSFFDLRDWTEFQKKVFLAASRIPFGETRTYAWVAAQMGQPFAARAVGQALKRNPLLIAVPCHRVVSSRSLGGFMGVSAPDAQEIKLKQALLDLEHEFRNPRFSFLWNEVILPTV